MKFNLKGFRNHMTGGLLENVSRNIKRYVLRFDVASIIIKALNPGTYLRQFNLHVVFSSKSSSLSYSPSPNYGFYFSFA